MEEIYTVGQMAKKLHKSVRIVFRQDYMDLETIKRI